MGIESLSTRDFLEIVIYTISVIGVVVINCFLFLRAKKIVLVQYFFRIQALVGIRMVAKIFKVIAMDDDVMWLWLLVEYFAICYFSVELLAFAYIYKYNKVLAKKVHFALLVIASINYFVLFTNEYHHWFYEKILLFHSLKGPYFYVQTVFSYILIVIAISMIVTSEANKRFSRKDRILLLVGLTIPLLINLGYLIHMFNIQYDLSPITFNIVILSFGLIAFRNNYYDMQIMTRLKILENLYEGIVILDKDNRILEFNKKIIDIVSPMVTIKKYTKFEKLFEYLEPYIIDYDQIARVYKEFIISPQTEAKSDVVIRVSDSIQNYYVFSLQKIYSSHGETTGSIIKLVDMTKYHLLMEELGDKNKKLQEINSRLNENISVKKRLVIEQERNRASKEVHDILGYSVTLVISLLEIIKVTYGEKPEFAKEKVIQAKEITRNGLNELKQSLTNKKDISINTETLVEDLEQLIDGFISSGVDVEFITNHYLIKIKPKYYDTIYRICQESMTNALRHGKADKITIAVRFSEQSVNIIIADNGNGCNDFIKGNGIKGMEQRVKDLDGFFSCGSPDGEGFNLHVIIPIVRELLNINSADTIY